MKQLAIMPLDLADDSASFASATCPGTKLNELHLDSGLGWSPIGRDKWFVMNVRKVSLTGNLMNDVIGFLSPYS